MKYRRRTGKAKSNVWHFCVNCSVWPPDDRDHLEVERKPTYGEFCNQCQAKAKRGACTTAV